MKRFLGLFVLIAACVPALSQSDARIQGMVAAISPARLRATVEALVSFGTRNIYSDRVSDTRGIGAATRWLKAQFQQISNDNGGRLQVAEDSFDQAGTTITNVVATLPGSSDKVLVVSSHIDSRGSNVNDGQVDAPGADDNASGVALVLELARVMCQYSYRHTIVFVAFSAEEQGLYGSAHWVNAAKAANMKIIGNLNNDLIGASTSFEKGPRFVRLYSEAIPTVESLTESGVRKSTGAENDGPSRQLARYVAEAARQYVPTFVVRLINRRDRYLRGSDHVSFNNKGYAAVRFAEGAEDFKHQHQNVRADANGVVWGDLIQFVDFDYLANVARVNLAGLASLAFAPAAPTSASIDASRLENDTRFSWTPVTDPDVAGYVVRWRDTMAPEWQYSRVVGKSSVCTLRAIPKDNFVFGVQTIDRMGHLSTVTPAR